MKYKFPLILTFLLVVFTTFAINHPVQASQFGTWSPTGSMTISRMSHTATLLTDGRVLVTGGITTRGSTTATAELFDAAQGTWIATNSMATPRSQHTATLLPDGRVLITGGSFRGASLSTAEFFDPVTGTWSSTSRMNSSRSNHVAMLLSDGRVLVTGGVSSASSAPVENSAEIYDPQTGVWSLTEHMVNARYNHQATLLMDGRVLVTGGFNVSAFHVPMQTTELYDPITNKWSIAANMLTPRATHLSFLLQDGRVLVGGGWTQPPNVLTPTTTAEMYDPITDHWTPTGAISLARGAVSSGAVLLPDGRVLVAGGRDTNGFLATVEIYDPLGGLWNLTASMGSERSGSHTATVLADGRVLVTGGRGSSGGPLSTAEVYTP